MKMSVFGATSKSTPYSYLEMEVQKEWLHPDITRRRDLMLKKEKTVQENSRNSRKLNSVFIGLGVLLLAVLLIAGSGVKDGLIALLAYIPLYIFIRYLNLHR